MNTVQDMTESYLSQSDKHELQALLSCGSFEENETSENEDDEENDAPTRGILSAAEYARNVCAFDRNDAIRNGLHPAHVSAARRSLPVGWAW
jgi:hypothetical protein